MAFRHLACAAALIALAACANSEHAARDPANIASIKASPAVPEFHGASIGGDALRSRLASE